MRCYGDRQASQGCWKWDSQSSSEWWISNLINARPLASRARPDVSQSTAMSYPAPPLARLFLLAGLALAGCQATKPTSPQSPAAADLRLGLIGLDTSHVIAFTEILNDPAAQGHVEGARVGAAFKGGSPDIPSSASRVEGYTKTLVEKHGVKLYDSIEAMCRDVDAVLVESVDGRPHLEQSKPVIAAHKPLYIDKPMAGSLKDG